MDATPLTAGELQRLAAAFTASDPRAVIDADTALSAAEVGLCLFDPPLLGFAAADDPLFAALRAPGVVGPQLLLPGQWLPGAQSVVSVCMPFSAAVRESNRRDRRAPSFGWLHARYEGQAFIGALLRYLMQKLAAAGCRAAAPSLDPRFQSWSGDADGGYGFNSNWSERHAAYVAGLGTFGLSAGLITEKGVAARYGSLITDAAFPPSERKYTEVYEYCNRCGACVRNCPAGAISLEQGKDHAPCSRFVDWTAEKYHPRYGCGKCQVGVPCEHARPPRRRG